MIPMIVRVWCENGATWMPTHVPVTPQTTYQDVLDCCREPGDERCLLFTVHPHHGVQVLRESDSPIDVVSVLGPEVQFVLKYIDDQTESTDKCNGMKEPGSAEELLGEGVELTVGELRAMALRQQQQIDTQHQLLCAKEQRLRYLKQQEARQHQVALEGERLRRLRERVEAQELKLRRLRALRGQIDRNKQANNAFTSDLESIRALFNEKEKELSVAVAKVDELTRQLEDLRPGRLQPEAPSAHELDKLRRELTYRNKLNEQQNGRLSAQRAALGARQEEMRSIDHRVSQLQSRLLRQRSLNRQLAAAHRHQPHQRFPNAPLSHGPGTPRSNGARGNVAAVEPYNHVPYAHAHTQSHTMQAMKQGLTTSLPEKQLTQMDNIPSQMNEQEAHYMQQEQMLYNGGYSSSSAYSQSPPYVQQGISNATESIFDKMTFNITHNPYEYTHDFSRLADGNKQDYSPNGSNGNQTVKEQKINEQEFLPEFAASKTDPKYQTLPYNTKFPPNAPGRGKAAEIVKSEAWDGAAVNHMTVHSTPLSLVNKSLATPLSQLEPSAAAAAATYHDGKENHVHQNNNRSNLNTSDSQQSNNSKVSQNSVMKNTSFASNTSTTSMSFGKPVSSVAPTSVQLSNGKPSPIYQTSSTKIQPVQPQTVQTQSISVQPAFSAVVSNQVASQTQMLRKSSSLTLSPPLGASSPLADAAADTKPKPALPPKPTAKTQPRQLSSSDVPASQQKDDTASVMLSSKSPIEGEHQQPRDKDSMNGSTSSGSTTNDMIIKAKPLTIRKPPISEQPKLRSATNAKNPININRRIEIIDLAKDDGYDEFPNGLKSKNLTRRNDIADLTKEPTFDELQNVLKIKENSQLKDEVDKALNNNVIAMECDKQDANANKESIAMEVESQNSVEMNGQDSQLSESVLRRSKRSNLRQGGKAALAKRVSFDPLFLLLDASLEGELELVKKTATQVQNASAANEEGITALHNAICAGHFEIVKFLVEFGCDVNAQDADGWTPLHCAASCNNLPMVRFLVDNGACIFATTLSDHETAAEKCEEDEEGFDGCSEYLYSIQEKLGIMNGGAVFAVFAYSGARADELSFESGARLQVIRKGDDSEREWWWSADAADKQGYVPRNLLGLYPRVLPQQD